jgi:hypothetical protein
MPKRVGILNSGLTVVTPEFNLLVRACGRARKLPLFEISETTRHKPAIDEKLFVRLAFQHKVAATALTGMKMLGQNLQPEHSQKLKQYALQAKILRALILEGAGVITEALSKAGIPSIVLKGPASSLQLYRDALTREYTDLDILINLPAVDAAIPIMSTLGYEAADYQPAKNARFQGSRLIARGHHVVFWKKGSPFRVELHDRSGWERELFARDNIDEVFDRAVRLEQEGRAFYSPALPDHAALIIAHGTQHAWTLLHWLLDAAALAACDNTGMQKDIADRICALDMQCQFKLAYELTRKLFPIELPQALKLSIGCKAPLEKSVAFAFARLQTGAGDISTMKNMFAFRFTYASPLFKTAKGKFTSAARLFQIPLQDAEALPLPRPLLFLHLFLRPFFVMSRRLKRILKRRSDAHE